VEVWKYGNALRQCCVTICSVAVRVTVFIVEVCLTICSAAVNVNVCSVAK
jgi:hypothetical protein